SHLTAAVTSVGIKLNTYRVRVEVMEIDLNVKDMLPAFSLHLHLTKAERAPFLLQTVPPIKYLPADCALIGNAQMVDGCSREVLSLGVFAHRAVGAKVRCQLRHAFPHPPNPSGRNTLIVA